ncbi:hypothetical protein [Flavobacterium kingsejongi]|uniref:Phage portal protein n=1 Tax=Flavobacterium kingsejongi TaxID=1678728 RepID=A0A2S1LU62_9FLAO|nr:hypothetical protein [Flavobacterium kingsejongi]AWG27191.1 hypothetical protein FK004_19200 [Flavobacterium kingsejongi]
MADSKPIDNTTSSIEVFQLSSVPVPVMEEIKSRSGWMNFGSNNCHYNYILDRYYGSPTNKTIIDSYSDFICGKAITAPDRSMKPDQYAQMLSIIKLSDHRNICTDLSIFNECCFEVILSKSTDDVVEINHLPKQNVVPGLPNSNGVITDYWFSYNWSKLRDYPAVKIPVFDIKTKVKKTIFIIKPYQPGKVFFNVPTYFAGLRAAYSEEQLEIYYNNHIDNGLSFGHIINIVGDAEEEVKKAHIKEVKKQLTGANNAGKVVISYNSDKDNKTTVEALEVSEAHKQYEFLSNNSKQQIMISHRVTSPILFGIKDNTGFGNNAEEMKTAFDHLMKMVISPKQNLILEGYKDVLKKNDISLSLEIDQLDLNDVVVPEAASAETSAVEMSSQNSVDEISDYLIELGEVEDLDEWQCISTEEISEHHILNDKLINLAKVPSSFPNAGSEQDNDLFKIRYSYAPNRSHDKTRTFCKKMVEAGKVYRIEDINLASDKVVNPGFGPHGADKYDILLYKGGPRCRHFWMRKIYMRKTNKNISVNEALKIINELEPADRSKVRLPVNDKKVAMLPDDMPNNGFLNPKK